MLLGASLPVTTSALCCSNPSNRPSMQWHLCPASHGYVQIRRVGWAWPCVASFQTTQMWSPVCLTWASLMRKRLPSARAQRSSPRQRHPSLRISHQYHPRRRHHLSLLGWRRHRAGMAPISTAVCCKGKQPCNRCLPGRRMWSTARSLRRSARITLSSSSTFVTAHVL